MSENLHNIDDLFKKAIDEHGDTPSLKVWEAIDKNLDKKKVVSISKKYNKLKWAAAVLLLASFGMAMYTWQTRMKNKELVKQNNINKVSKIKNKTKTKNNNNKNFTLPEIITPQNEKNSDTQNKKQINSPLTQTVTNTDKQKNQQENFVQQNITTAQKEKNLLPTSSQHNNTAKDKEKVEQTLAANQDEKKSEQFDKNNKQQKNKRVIIRDNIKTKVPENTITTPEKYIVDAPIIFINVPKPYGILEIQSVNPFSNSLPFLSASAENITEKNKNASSKKSTAKSTKSSLFSATIFFSPEFVFSNVKDDHPRFREDNRNEIKNNEKIISSSSYGLLLEYSVGSNWKLQSGVAVFTRVTGINTKIIYARPDNNGNVNYRLSCSAGSVYVPLKSGANPSQGDSTKILSAKNTLQYISIPLAVKYVIGKGKLNLVPGVGISANILSKGKTETVIATTGGSESSGSNNIEGLKSNYFNSQISLGAQYHLSKKIALNFTPTARLALSSINKNAAVKTKLNSFGLSAGITIKL